MRAPVDDSTALRFAREGPTAADFGPFGGRAWLNTAHHGPLPRVAVEGAAEAIEMMVAPQRIPDEAFLSIPRRLKLLLGLLIGAPAEDIVLGNSASYGLHLIANGIPWRPGDEVVVPAGDFPATILPWRGLGRRGVTVRLVQPRGPVLSARELQASLSSATRLVCASWVHSLNGHAVDVDALGEACRERRALFVLDASQGIGVRPFDVRTAPVDAVVACGSKWLCGPYGTGFCWMTRELRDLLEYNQAYWQAHWEATQPRGRADLNSEGPIDFAGDLGARGYDMFGTANFLNFMPWAASLEYLLDRGIATIARYDSALVSRLTREIEDSSGYRLVSPSDERRRTTILVLTHRDPARNRAVYAFLGDHGVDVALRGDLIRVSPHINNTTSDIERLLELLAAAA